MKVLILALLIPGWLVPVPALAHPEAATPQRPSFSADPNTTAPGTLELEAGFVAAEGEQRDTPLTLKWGAGPATELFVGWSPWVRAGDIDGADGAGDTVVGARHRFLHLDDGPDFAFQLTGKIPTAADALGSGLPDVQFALTSAQSWGNWTGVAYFQSGFTGRPESGSALVDHGLALVLATPLGGSVSAFVETTGIWIPELGETTGQVLLGLGYTLRENIVLDLAAGVADVEDGGQTNLAVGSTANLGPVPR